MIFTEDDIKALKDKWIGKYIKFTTYYTIRHGFYSEMASWTSEGTVTGIGYDGKLHGTWSTHMFVKPEEVTEILEDGVK